MRPLERHKDTATYVRVMVRLLKLTLTAEQYEGYLNAVDCMLSAGSTPLDIQALHRILYPDCVAAGEYRTTAVFDNEKYTIERLPRSPLLSQFVERKFARAYAAALIPDTPYDPALMAWSVAACLRCLKLFKYGNWEVSHLVQTHIGRVHGLLPIYKPRPLRAYHEFRDYGFAPVFDRYYVEVPGT